MVLVSEIRDSILREFSLNDGPKTDQLVVSKTNEAIKYVSRSLGYRLPWLYKEISIDIPAGTSISVTFTKSSRGAILNSGTVSIRGSIFHGGRYYLIESITGNSIILDMMFLDESGTYTVIYSDLYYELPSNFVAIESTSNVLDLNNIQLRPTNKHKIQKLKNRFEVVSIDQHYYTITRDPIGVTNSDYFHYFPYYSEINSVKLGIHINHPKISSIIDEVNIPEKDEDIIINCVSWFVAANKKFDESVWGHHRFLVLQSIEALSKTKHNIDEEIGADYGIGYTIDMSDVRDMVFEDDPDFVPNIV